MLSIQKKISAFNHGNGNEHTYIIIHYTGNQGDTAKNNVDYFSGGDRQASAHLFVDDSSIWQSVEFENYSWNCGDGGGQYEISNKNTLAIEMCCQSNGEVSDTTENNTVELVKYLMSKYSIGIDRVVRHYDASRKICPNWSSNNWSRWNNFKSKISQDDSKYKLESDGDMTKIFSGSWYAKTYPDVVAVYGESESELYKHYVDYGKAEGRLALPPIPEGFTITGYLECNVDLKDALNKGIITNVLNHYYDCGWYEGRQYIYIPPVDQSKEVEGLKKQLEESKNNTIVDNSSKETFYRVVTGSYKQRTNADDQIAKLKAKGFDSFVDIFKK